MRTYTAQPAGTPLQEDDPATPQYARIRSAILRRITSGLYQPGAVIPSEGALAREFGVTRETIRHALDSLKRSGRLRSQRGVGTIVHDPPIEQSLLTFYSFGRREWRADESVETVLIGCTPDQMPDSPETAAWRIERIRTIDNQPFIYECSHVPYTFARDLDQRFSASDSLYTVLSTEYGLVVGTATEYLQAVTVEGEVAHQLGLPPGSPALETRRVVYDATGDIMELRVSTVRTDLVRFRVDLQ